MRTPPRDLADAEVAGVLRSAFSIDARSIEYAPVGFGSHHWRVAADHQWFVTVDTIAHSSGCASTGDDAGALLRAALSTARGLRDLGLEFVVAPIVSNRGEVAEPIDDRYLLAVYLHVDGESHGWGAFATAAERAAVLERLADLHAAPVEALQSATADDLALPCRGRLEAALAETSHAEYSGPFAEPVRRLLADHAGSIAECLRRYDRQCEDVLEPHRPIVVTHGEPHRGNTMITPSGVVLVDWDTVRLAPAERDLWWLSREDPAIVDRYEHATGRSVTRSLLELYERKWDLTDLALFVAELLGPHEDTADTRTTLRSLATVLVRLAGRQGASDG